MPSHRKTKRKKDGQRGNSNGNHDARKTTTRAMREYQEKVRPLPKKCGQTENRRPTTAKTRTTPKRGPHTEDAVSNKTSKDGTNDPVRDPLHEEDRKRAFRTMEILLETNLSNLSMISIKMSMMTATCVLVRSLPVIHRRGSERRKQRSKITRRLQDKITSRDYAGLLYMATMSTLHHQKGRTSAMFLTLTGFDNQIQGNRTRTSDQEGKHRKGTKKAQNTALMGMHESSAPPWKPTKKKEPRYALAMHRRVETWTVHGGGPASGRNQLIEKAPWMVPPWESN